MNADHERFAEWDAAYLLGALSAADRLEYEAHLARCPECRAAVGEVAPTLGLLSRVSPERASSLLHAAEPESPPAEHRAHVLSLAAARRRRRRRTWIVGVAAAVVIAVTSVAVPLASQLLQPPARTVALEQVIDAPLSASVTLADVAWGTRIDMTCAYGPGGDAPADGWAYAMVVVADDGTESVLSTWRARPGSTAKLSAGTELPASGIAAVEIRSVRTGEVLMRTGVDAL
jgi:hypothetical protein